MESIFNACKEMAFLQYEFPRKFSSYHSVKTACCNACKEMAFLQYEFKGNFLSYHSVKTACCNACKEMVFLQYELQAVPNQGNSFFFSFCVGEFNDFIERAVSPIASLPTPLYITLPYRIFLNFR